MKLEQMLINFLTKATYYDLISPDHALIDQFRYIKIQPETKIKLRLMGNLS